MIEKLDSAIIWMEQAEFLRNQLTLVSELRERLYRRELIISVIGQFKRGKSSLINALLEDDILPVGIIPLTTAVTEIRQGDNFRGVAQFIDGSECEIKRNELSDYISEQKNPNNQKEVTAVKLWTEFTPFGSGITLVDTPGVGSIHQHNTQTSQTYIEKSDVVLFLLSVDSPVSETERNFLLEAREHAAKFYFAVNKTDTISKEDLREFLSYCQDVLSQSIGTSVDLYPVSAKTGGGIPGLTAKITEDLRVFHDDLLEASLSIKLNAIISQANAKLTLYLEAAAMPAEELAEKILQIQAKQLSLDTHSDEVQVLIKTRIGRLVEHINTELEKMLPNILTTLKNKAQEEYETTKTLTPRQFEIKFTAALENILREKITELDNTGLGMLQEGYSNIVNALNKKATDTARYISEMVKESFGIEYPLNAKEYSVSERDDNFIRLTLHLDTSIWAYLLPKAVANARIFDRLMEKAAGDLYKNKTGMLYNYRYKMQESLRLLSAEFLADISRMNEELNELLIYVKQSHSVQKDKWRQREGKYELIREHLDQLR